MRLQRRLKFCAFVFGAFGALAGCSPPGYSAPPEEPTQAAPAPPEVKTRGKAGGQFVGGSGENVRSRNGYRMSSLVGTQESQLEGKTQSGYKVYVTIKSGQSENQITK